ncbi:MAG: ribosome silencing factor [Acidobacteriaceae bacterium]|nr:ribosome silencing factor [Acidobacteriaceae bacterium]
MPVKVKKPVRRPKNSAPSRLFGDLRIRPQCSTLRAGERSELLTNRAVIPSSEIASADLPNWAIAARAAESKKAEDLRVLDLREVTSFTDYFILCTVSNPRQGHAVSDEIHKQLKEIGELPVSQEGYEASEWILMDYGDFIVHIFSQTARSYYDLERLWRHAKSVDLPAAS